MLSPLAVPSSLPQPFQPGWLLLFLNSPRSLGCIPGCHAPASEVWSCSLAGSRASWLLCGTDTRDHIFSPLCLPHCFWCRALCIRWLEHGLTGEALYLDRKIWRPCLVTSYWPLKTNFLSGHSVLIYKVKSMGYIFLWGLFLILYDYVF